MSKTNSWYILILVISISIFSGCDAISRVQDAPLKNFETGFKKGINCAELALKEEYPVEYCYKVLDILVNEIRTENGKK